MPVEVTFPLSIFIVAFLFAFLAIVTRKEIHSIVRPNIEIQKSLTERMYELFFTAAFFFAVGIRMIFKLF